MGFYFFLPPPLQVVLNAGKSYQAASATETMLIIKNSNGNVNIYFRSASSQGKIGIADNSGTDKVNILAGSNANFIAGAISIGTTSIADTSTILQLVSNTKGFGLPAMSTAQKNAIGSPIDGNMVFDTGLNAACIFYSADWHTITSI